MYQYNVFWSFPSPVLPPSPLLPPPSLMHPNFLFSLHLLPYRPPSLMSPILNFFSPLKISLRVMVFILKGCLNNMWGVCVCLIKSLAYDKPLINSSVLCHTTNKKANNPSLFWMCVFTRGWPSHKSPMVYQDLRIQKITGYSYRSLPMKKPKPKGAMNSTF